MQCIAARGYERGRIRYYYVQSTSEAASYYKNESGPHQIQHISLFNTRSNLLRKWNQVPRLGARMLLKNHASMSVLCKKELDNAAIEVLVKLVAKIKHPSSWVCWIVRMLHTSNSITTAPIFIEGIFPQSEISPVIVHCDCPTVTIVHCDKKDRKLHLWQELLRFTTAGFLNRSFNSWEFGRLYRGFPWMNNSPGFLKGSNAYFYC